jgi:hypothetical protein
MLPNRASANSLSAPIKSTGGNEVIQYAYRKDETNRRRTRSETPYFMHTEAFLFDKISLLPIKKKK